MSHTYEDLARIKKPAREEGLDDLRGMLDGLDLSAFELPDPETAQKLGSSGGFGNDAVQGLIGSGMEEKTAPDPTPAERLTEIVGESDADMIPMLEPDKVGRLADTYSGVRQQKGNYESKSGNKVILDLLFDDPLADLVDGQRAACAGLEPWQVLRQVVGSIRKTVDTDKEGRDDAFQSVGAAPLGELVQTGKTMCREKALYAHLLLAAEGIPTWIVAASREDGNETHGRHAWLETEDGHVIDAMWGQIAPSGTSEHRNRYVKDVKTDQPMKPATPLAPEVVAAAVDRAKGKVS